MLLFDFAEEEMARRRASQRRPPTTATPSPSPSSSPKDCLAWLREFVRLKVALENHDYRYRCHEFEFNELNRRLNRERRRQEKRIQEKQMMMDQIEGQRIRDQQEANRLKNLLKKRAVFISNFEEAQELFKLKRNGDFGGEILISRKMKESLSSQIKRAAIAADITCREVET